MTSLQYHSVDPSANRAVFKEFNTVDFEINSDRNLVAGSVRIEGELRCTSDGSTRHTAANRAYINRRVGMHNMISSIQTQINGSVVENIGQDYSRIVHMVQSATKGDNDYYDSSQLCELKAPSTNISYQYTAGAQVPASGGDGVNIDLDFSFKPYICLNRASDNLQLSRVGNSVKISLNLERNLNFLSGVGQLTTSTYEIRNLRMTFQTVDPSPVPSVVMNSVVPIKHVLNSSFSNVSSKVPAVCHAVSGSFLKFSKENQIKTDNLALESPPNLQEVQIMFNDSTNQLTQYVLDDYGQFLHGYLESLKNSGNSEASPNNVKGNSVFGIGLNFNDEVDLSNEKVSVQVKSDVSTGNEYLLYLYFHSRISV